MESFYWYLALREKCPYLELFWSAFSCVRTEYGEILCISPYSVQMLENTDQNNSEYGHFLHQVGGSIYQDFSLLQLPPTISLSIHYSRKCKSGDQSTTIEKIYETNSSFHVKKRSTRKLQFLFFSSFLLVSEKFWVQREDWALGYNSMKF